MRSKSASEYLRRKELTATGNELHRSPIRYQTKNLLSHRLVEQKGSEAVPLQIPTVK